MQHKYHRYDAGSFMIYIDSGYNGELTGRYYHPIQGETGQFGSLMQLLLRIEQLMDEIDGPQSFQVMRTFTPAYVMDSDNESAFPCYSGKVATFQLHIRFRRNASWQGTVIWADGGKSSHFRSVLELITLMNSAISSEENMLQYVSDKELGLFQVSG